MTAISPLRQFARNQYTLTYEAAEGGNKQACATNEKQGNEDHRNGRIRVGHHFVAWDDGVTMNPRVTGLTADRTLTAIFLSLCIYIPTALATVIGRRRAIYRHGHPLGGDEGGGRELQ